MRLGPAELIMLGEMARAIGLDSVAKRTNQENLQITSTDILLTIEITTFHYIK